MDEGFFGAWFLSRRHFAVIDSVQNAYPLLEVLWIQEIVAQGFQVEPPFRDSAVVAIVAILVEEGFYFVRVIGSGMEEGSKNGRCCNYYGL